MALVEQQRCEPYVRSRSWRRRIGTTAVREAIVTGVDAHPRVPSGPMALRPLVQAARPAVQAAGPERVPPQGATWLGGVLRLVRRAAPVATGARSGRRQGAVTLPNVRMEPADRRGVRPAGELPSAVAVPRTTGRGTEVLEHLRHEGGLAARLRGHRAGGASAGALWAVPLEGAPLRAAPGPGSRDAGRTAVPEADQPPATVVARPVRAVMQLRRGAVPVRTRAARATRRRSVRPVPTSVPARPVRTSVPARPVRTMRDQATGVLRPAPRPARTMLGVVQGGSTMPGAPGAESDVNMRRGPELQVRDRLEARRTAHDRRRVLARMRAVHGGWLVRRR